MENLSVWIFLLALFLAVYIGMAREGRLAIGGYVAQTVMVVVIYGISAMKSGDAGIWWAMVGLFVIRVVVIPGVVMRFFTKNQTNYRSSPMVMTPTFALLLYVLLASIGIGIGMVMGTSGGLFEGLSLAVLLVSIGVVAVNHQAIKQIFGILSGDNAVDLLISLTLSRVAVAADYVVFIDVSIAVYLLSILTIRHRHHGQQNISHMNELKG